MEVNFKDRIVGLTGYSKFHGDYDMAIARIIRLEGGIVVGDSGSSTTWEVEQLIIVGDIDFDKNFLIKSIEVGIEHNFVCQYISLDDFWDYYSDDFTPYYEGDPRIDTHEGLSYLASLYFEYPTVNIFGFGNRNSNRTNDWSFESLLKANFGYSVRQGISKKARRKALEKAVNSSNIISLKEIAEHIVFNINLRKGQDNMNPAINRWLEDLKWLKQEYYNPSVHSFKFPSPH